MKGRRFGGDVLPCRSMLYIPGNAPGMIQHCPAYGADGVLLDLEDAVALSEKDAARELTARFLERFDFRGLVVTVRINGADTPQFEADLRRIIPLAPHAVRLPKCGGAEDVQSADRLIGEIERASGLPDGAVAIHAMLETALGIENAFQVARASRRVRALTLGGQDLTADLGIQKTREGHELAYARSRVVTAARAARMVAYDTVWTDFDDPEGLFQEAKLACELGFAGKAAIHPGQIEGIHRAFRPDPVEVRRARRIVTAAEEAEKRGRGVVAVDGRMVDGPIVERARSLLVRAERYREEEFA